MEVKVPSKTTAPDLLPWWDSEPKLIETNVRRLALKESKNADS